MKKLLILPLLLAFQLVSGQWNVLGWNPYNVRDTEGDSTFVLSSPSRDSLQEGVASWVPASSGGGASYMVYTALISQSATDDPTAIVLENTIGTVTFARNGAGDYNIVFTAPCNNLLIAGDTDNGVEYQIYATDDTHQGSVLVSCAGGSGLSIITRNASRTLEDDILFKFPIEIKYYP